MKERSNKSRSSLSSANGDCPKAGLLDLLRSLEKADEDFPEIPDPPPEPFDLKN